MFMTKTEADAVHRYLSMRDDRIALGSMMDSQDRGEYRQIREIAELAVRNARRRERELDELYLSLSVKAANQLCDDITSGAYARKMNLMNMWDEWFRSVR